MVPRRSDWLALGGLYGFTAAAVAGYGLFALNPQRLPASGLALAIFRVSFQAFAQLHIVLAFGVLAWLLFRHVRLAWWAPLAAVYALSFTAEHVGTGYGVPFGGYGYTGLLGAKLGGRVPALIPLSWFLMALPSWVLARAAWPHAGGALRRMLLGALWLTVWDLALDPAMSHLTAYWRWEETGPYYGMPWPNLAGWYATGLVLMGALELAGGWSRLDRLTPRWMGAYYAAMMAMPLGMLVVAGAWLGVLVTLGGVSVAGAVSLALARRGRGARDDVTTLSPVGA